MANRTKWTAKKRKEFLDALARSGNVTLSARKIGLSRSRFYELREADKLFAAEWDTAVEEYTDLLVSEAERRGRQGTLKPVFYKGKICGKIREYSDALLMFCIKGRRPEYSTERREIAGKGELIIRYVIPGEDEGDGGDPD